MRAVRDLKEEPFYRCQREKQGLTASGAQVGITPAQYREAESSSTHGILYLPHTTCASPSLLGNESSLLSVLGMLCSAKLSH